MTGVAPRIKEAAVVGRSAPAWAAMHKNDGLAVWIARLLVIQLMDVAYTQIILSVRLYLGVSGRPGRLPHGMDRFLLVRARH